MNKVICPYCGNTTGYYKLIRISGTVSDMYDGNRNPEVSNTADLIRLPGRYQSTIHYKHMKTAYCRKCHMKIDLRKIPPSNLTCDTCRFGYPSHDCLECEEVKNGKIIFTHWQPKEKIL